MWVEKLPSGRYRYCERYLDPATQTYKRVSCTLDSNSKQAHKIAAEILRNKAYTVKPSPLTFGELCDLYLADQSRTVKLSTLKRNMGCLNRLKSILGDSVASQDISAGYVRRKLLDTGREPGTMNEYIKRLKSMMRWAYKMDYVDNPLDKLDLFPDVPKRVKVEDKFLESSEISVLLESMNNDRWRTVTEFLVLSGLRFGECAALRRSDVDMNKRTISVTKNYDERNRVTTTPKTHSSIRDVYIQDELLAVCRDLLGGVIDMSGLLFSQNHHEISYAAYRKYLHGISEKTIGRAVTPHTLRHTHASLMLEAGMDVDTIAARLGHSSTKITQEIYLHVTERLEQQRNERMKNVRIIVNSLS